MSAAPINAEALRLARESRGHPQAEVARQTGISQSLLSKLESTVVTSLDEERLKTLSAFLDYPASFFVEPKQIREVGSPCLYHRMRKTLPKKLLTRLDARMFVRHINVEHLLNGLDVEGDRMFHALDPDEYGSAIEVARRLRTAWHLPDGPIHNLTALIESAGGIVLVEEFGTRKLFGMSCWMAHGRPLFFLNAAIPTEDLRWTMAHELGHLTMHGTPSDGDQEQQADAFAGELLAPQSVFSPQARRLSFQRLPQLKAYWRISMKAVIKRAEVIGAIDRSAAVRLYKQHSARGFTRAEPYPLNPEPPTIIHQAIRVHLQDHKYTAAELAEAMRLTPEEFQRDFCEVQPMARANVINLFGHGDPSIA
jgi:Zn-dependent peptidase ImmA (M78 family)